MARKYKHLTYEGRQCIERMIEGGSSVREIAGALGVHRDTIYK